MKERRERGSRKTMPTVALGRCILCECVFLPPYPFCLVLTLSAAHSPALVLPKWKSAFSESQRLLLGFAHYHRSDNGKTKHRERARPDPQHREAALTNAAVVVALPVMRCAPFLCPFSDTSPASALCLPSDFSSFSSLLHLLIAL